MIGIETVFKICRINCGPVFDVVMHSNKVTGPQWRIYSKTVIADGYTFQKLKLHWRLGVFVNLFYLEMKTRFDVYLVSNFIS